MSAPIRVMHMIHDLKSEGAQTTVAELINQRDPARVDCALLTFYEGETALTRGSHEAPVRRYCANKRRGPDARVLRLMYEAVKEYQPHIVHTHCYALRYALPLLLTHREITIIHSVQNMAEKDCGRPYWLLRAGYRAGVIPVAVSKAVGDSLQRLYGISPHAIIPNSVEVSEWRRDRYLGQRCRSRLRLGAEQVVFVSVASLTPKKNHARLLRAFRKARDEIGWAVLLLVGSGPSRSDLETLAASVGVGGDVMFLGARDDVHEILCASDIFVLSSDREGLPLAVMEAMAAELPVIATSVGGVPEIVEHGRTGLLVDPRDEDALARAMIDLAQDQERRQEMADAALEASQRFDASHMVASYESIYDLAVAVRKERRGR